MECYRNPFEVNNIKLGLMSVRKEPFRMRNKDSKVSSSTSSPMSEIANVVIPLSVTSFFVPNSNSKKSESSYSH